MKVILDYTQYGVQVRKYGPRVFELTVAIEPGSAFGPTFEYGRTQFEYFAKQNTVDWDNQPDDWYRWELKEAVRLRPHQWYFRIELPYDD